MWLYVLFLFHTVTAFDTSCLLGSPCTMPCTHGTQTVAAPPGYSPFHVHVPNTTIKERGEYTCTNGDVVRILDGDAPIFVNATHAYDDYDGWVPVTRRGKQRLTEDMAGALGTVGVSNVAEAWDEPPHVLDLKDCTLVGFPRPCESNFYGHQQCTFCDSGHETNTGRRRGATSCDVCRGTHYDHDLDATTACVHCSSGYEHTPTSCTICPPSTFSPVSSTPCTICPPGHVTDTLSVAGATTCTACIAGTYSSRSTQACFNCTVGHVTNAENRPGATTCTACPVLFYDDDLDSRTNCTLCTPGSTTNTLGQTGGTFCTPCPVTMYSSQSSNACVLCPPGSITDTRSSVGGTTCTSCPRAYYSPSSNFSCTACPDHANTTINERTSLDDCLGNAGWYGCQSGTCTHADEGYVSIEWNNTHAPCTTGTYQQETTQSICKDCVIGTYQNQMGKSSCLSCPEHSTTAGKESQDLKSCLGDAGWYDCHTGTCQEVDDGYYSETMDDAMSPCTPGTYTDSSGQSICKNCAVGTYQDLPGQSSCKTCPALTNTTGMGRQSILDCFCDGGYYGSHGQCHLVEPGIEYSPPLTNHKLSCTQAAHTTNTLGASGAASCDACPADYFSPVSDDATVACTPCVSDHTSKAGSTACVSCDPSGSDYKQLCWRAISSGTVCGGVNYFSGRDASGVVHYECKHGQVSCLVQHTAQFGSSHYQYLWKSVLDVHACQNTSITVDQYAEVFYTQGPSRFRECLSCGIPGARLSCDRSGWVYGTGYTVPQVCPKN